jgi:hypothetical protein
MKKERVALVYERAVAESMASKTPGRKEPDQRMKRGSVRMSAAFTRMLSSEAARVAL